MPRNGTGTYTLPANSWNPAVTGTTIESSANNATMTDLAAALTQSVSNDGQTPMVGNLPMGNNKITGLANGTLSTDAATVGQVTALSGAYATLSGNNTFTGSTQIFTGSVNINQNLGVQSTVSARGLNISVTGTINNLSVSSVASAKFLSVLNVASIPILVAGNATGSVASGINASAISINGTSIGAASGLLRVTTFTTGGTWTKGADVGSVIVEVQGAGGSGARSNSNANAPTGGQCGPWAVSTVILAASLGGTETVTIGAGGAAVAGSSNTNGNAGGSTSFGAHVVCLGGLGGIFDSDLPVFIQTSVTPSGTHVQNSVKSINGESAQALPAATSAARGIMGARSKFGSPGVPTVDSNTNAVNASGFGAGGCSAANAISGVTSGAGSGGLVIVYEYA